MKQPVSQSVFPVTVAIVAVLLMPPPAASAAETTGSGPTVTIVYDNRPGAEELDPAWGFACIVEGLEKTILFDTGGDGPRLLRNMAQLGFTPADIDLVVLSHAHGDHTAGLNGFLEKHGEVAVYLLASFPGHIAEDTRKLGATVNEVSRPTRICEGAMVTGDLAGGSGIPEQALLLSGNAGSAVITGCAHPGIVHITEQAKAIIAGEILAALGGFHLVRQSESSINQDIQQLKKLGVRHIIPCHCSGDLAIGLFARAYGEEFAPCTVGTVIDLEGLINRIPEGSRVRSEPDDLER